MQMFLTRVHYTLALKSLLKRYGLRPFISYCFDIQYFCWKSTIQSNL